MTPKQTSLYWREWAKVRAVYPDADRHDLHHQALGRDKSSRAFTNADLDKVLGVFRAISEPANLTGQLRQMDQPCHRLRWRIRRLCPEAYREQIMRDRFGTTRLEDLDERQLVQLRNTLAARSNKLRRKEPKPASSTHA